jgi:hypothetical protein
MRPMIGKTKTRTHQSTLFGTGRVELITSTVQRRRFSSTQDKSLLSTKEERVFVPQTSMCKNNTMSPTPPAPAPKPYIGSVSMWPPEDEIGDPETNERSESKPRSNSNIILKVTREVLWWVEVGCDAR